MERKGKKKNETADAYVRMVHEEQRSTRLHAQTLRLHPLELVPTG
jgi:hypothetical protein